MDVNDCLFYTADGNENATDHDKNGTNCTSNSGSCVGELHGTLFVYNNILYGIMYAIIVFCVGESKAPSTTYRTVFQWNSTIHHRVNGKDSRALFFAGGIL